jgi:tetratricopeptide (TPR) repeat protein
LHHELSELDEIVAGERIEDQESRSDLSLTIHNMIAEVVPRGLTTSPEGDPMDLLDIFSQAAAGKPDSPSDSRKPIQRPVEEPTPLTRNTTTSVDSAEGHDGIFVPEFEKNETKTAGAFAIRIVKRVDEGETKTSDPPQSIPEVHGGAIRKDEIHETLSRSNVDDAVGSAKPPSEMDEHQQIIRTELPGASSSPQHRKSEDKDTHASSADDPVQSCQTASAHSIATPISFDDAHPDLPLSEVVTPKAAGGKARGFSRIYTSGTSEYQAPRAGKVWGSSERKDALESLRTSCGGFPDKDFYKALLMRGAQVISENPRDVPSFYCMYVISTFLSTTSEEVKIAPTPEAMVEFSRQCLLRCLTVSNQVASTGMIGWLEYGSSTHYLRDIERPSEILHAVACNYAHRQMWRDAEDTLKALVMSLEQHFPPHHPTTLAALLDLAAVSSVISNDKFATRTVKGVSQRLSFYLSEVEDRFFSRRDECITDRQTSDAVFRIDRDRDWLSMLTIFVSTFESHLDRELVRIIGGDNHITLVHHCLVADALVVLANCVETTTQSSRSGANRAADYWRQALIHYRHALKGFTRKLGLDDPNIAAAAYGAARCLRELGRTEEALQVLSKIVDISELAVAAESIAMATKSAPCNVASDRDQKRSSFLPQRCFRRRKPAQSRTHSGKRMSSALCFWLMAALTADINPDEGGRDRALSLLRSASKSLQLGLADIPERDSSIKVAYIDFLQKIEDEAKSLLGTPRDSERGREEQGSTRHHTNRPGYPMLSQQPKMWSL